MKYKNKPTVVDGIKFPSKRQAARYTELKLMERAGSILNLQLEVPFPLVVNGQKVGKYIADYVYSEPTVNGTTKVWERTVEDCKGFRTAVYKLKKRLMKAIHGVDIKET